MNWVVVEADWRADHQALSAIRREIFIEEQGVPESMEWDEDDATAIHFLVQQGTETLGVARLLHSGQIGRLAVAKSYRRQGIGSALLNAAISRAKERGLTEVFLHAQLSALPLYQPFGFAPEGEVFDEAGIPHQFMRKQLG